MYLRTPGHILMLMLTFEDIAKRANLSRTLLYRIFKDKEEIYQAVFVDWLVSRHPAAKQAAKGPGSPYLRLLRVCRLLALEPWAEMARSATTSVRQPTRCQITLRILKYARGPYDVWHEQAYGAALILVIGVAIGNLLTLFQQVTSQPSARRTALSHYRKEAITLSSAPSMSIFTGFTMDYLLTAKN